MWLVIDLSEQEAGGCELTVDVEPWETGTKKESELSLTALKHDCLLVRIESTLAVYRVGHAVCLV